MRTLLTRRAGQPGTKKLMAEYGADLVCVRYRYDEELRERIKTVEVVISRVEWHPGNRRTQDGIEVHFRLESREDLLRRAVLFAGGRWDEASDTWILPRSAVIALGLTPRISVGRDMEAEHAHDQIKHVPSRSSDRSFVLLSNTPMWR